MAIIIDGNTAAKLYRTAPRSVTMSESIPKEAYSNPEKSSSSFPQRGDEKYDVPYPIIPSQVPNKSKWRALNTIRLNLELNEKYD